METSTISLIITVAFLACLVVGFIRGFFKGIIKSGIDTFLGVLAVLVSFPVTRIIMGALVNSKSLSFIASEIMAALPSEFSPYVEAVKGYMESPESGALVGEVLELVAALPTIFIAPLIFLTVFLIIAFVLFGMGFFIKMFISSKKQKIGWRLFGGALGAATYILVLAVLVIPTNGYVNFTNEIAHHALEVVDANALPEKEEAENDVTEEKADGGIVNVSSSEEMGDGESGDIDEPTDGVYEEESESEGFELDPAVITPVLEGVIEYTSIAKENPILSVIHSFGGKRLFTSLTTVKTSSVSVNLEKELNGLIDICGVALKFVNTAPENYGEEQAIATEELNEILSSSDYIPELVSRVISFAAGELYQNGELFGFEKPNLGEEFNPALNRVLRVLKSTDANDLRKDINTVSKIASEALESGIVEMSVEGEFDVNALLEEKELFEAVFVELYKNSRTRNLIPYVMGYLTDYIYTLYNDINSSQTEVPEFDYSQYTEEQMYLEALYVTETIKEVKAFIETVDVTDNELDPKQIIMEADFAALGRGLENMRDSIFTERIFKIVVYAVLHSELAEKLAIVDADLIEHANDDDADLVSMLVSRQNIMKLAISIQEMTNRDQTNLLIGTVLESLLSEDTSSLTSIISKENLQIMGMNSQQAQSIEGIVGSMVNGASGFEFESEEEKQEEIKKTEEIIFAIGNTVLDEDREHHHMFDQGDGAGSTTDMTAESFVDTIVDSKLTSSMVQSATKNENGENVDNPYNLQGEISQGDVEEITNALNNKYAQDDVTEEQKQTLEALASIFGVKLN